MQQISWDPLQASKLSRCRGSAASGPYNEPMQPFTKRSPARGNGGASGFLIGGNLCSAWGVAEHRWRGRAIDKSEYHNWMKLRRTQKKRSPSARRGECAGPVRHFARTPIMAETQLAH